MKTTWTLLEGSNVPIVVQHEETTALFIYGVGNRTSLDAVRIQTPEQVFLVRSTGLEHAEGTTYHLRDTEARNTVGGYSELTDSNIEPFNREQRRLMLNNLRHLISTRTKPLPEWAAKIWHEGKKMIRQSVPPFKLGGVEVDEGTTLKLVLFPDDRGTHAAMELDLMLFAKAISMPLIFEQQLKEVVNNNAWPAVATGANVASITIEGDFNGNHEKTFQTKVLSGLQQITVLKR